MFETHLSKRTLLPLCPLILWASGSLSQGTRMSAQQDSKVVDLTVSQANVASLARFLELVQIPVLAPSHFPSPATPPLQVRIQSVSSVSSNRGIIVVEVLVRNSGAGTFYLPISRNLETLFENQSDNQNRRQFFWNLHLKSVGLPDEIRALGISTYRSSIDPGSAYELRSQDSVVIRFQADLSEPWNLDPARWKDGIPKGDVLAQVRVYEATLLDASTPGRRQYETRPSKEVFSDNTVPISFQP